MKKQHKAIFGEKGVNQKAITTPPVFDQKNNYFEDENGEGDNSPDVRKSAETLIVKNSGNLTEDQLARRRW